MQMSDESLATRFDSIKESAAQGSSATPWLLYRPWQRWGLLTILFLVTTSNYFDYFVLSVALDPIKREFHVSDTMLGLLGGVCFSLFYAAGALPIARWADLGNRRTVITFTLVGWSVMTAICGLTRSFWQLALARLGVGAMEPGALPPAQSLAADYFPPERRATALAILTQGGSSAGWLIGVALGGYIAATRGWRAAFMFAGLSGLFLAVVVRLLLSEPRRQFGFPRSQPDAETIRQSFTHLKSNTTFLLGLAGLSAYAIFSYGISLFLPSFMIRALSATLEQVSLTWGFAISAANLIGALAGGWLADTLSRRDLRWYAWLPALACLASCPLYWLALSSHRLWTFIVFDSLAEALISVGLPACFAGIHVICGRRRRVMAVAIVLFSMTLFGSSLGPLTAGALSDALSAAYGIQSLRVSLSAMLVFLLPAAACFSLFGRAMLREPEE